MGNPLLKFDDDFVKFCFTLATLSTVTNFIKALTQSHESNSCLLTPLMLRCVTVKLPTKILFMLANAIKSDSRKEN